MEQFKNNFMVIVAGDVEDKKDKFVQDFMKKVKDTRTNFYFMEGH